MPGTERRSTKRKPALLGLQELVDSHLHPLRKRGLTLLPWLECCGAIIAHCSLDLPGTRNPPTSASRVAEITGCPVSTVSCHASGILVPWCPQCLLAQSSPDWTVRPQSENAMAL
ncbi:Arginine-fifty homeobox, partial [Plecturocebus cupreus]